MDGAQHHDCQKSRFQFRGYVSKSNKPALNQTVVLEPNRFG